MPQFSDDLMLGPVPVPGGGANKDGPSLMDVGAGPLGRIYVWDVVAATSNTTGVALGQAVTTGMNLTLTAGGGATVSTSPTGEAVIVLDVPRALTVLSASPSDVTQMVTFTGYDQYWQPLTAQVTMAVTTVVSTKKAFKYLKTAAVNTSCVGNIVAGFGDKLGFPYKVAAVEYVDASYAGAIVTMASITSGDTTSPATALTGDVRGILNLPAAADGTKRVVAMHALSAIQCGPNATKAGLYGVTQA